MPQLFTSQSKGRLTWSTSALAGADATVIDRDSRNAAFRVCNLVAFSRRIMVFNLV